MQSFNKNKNSKIDESSGCHLPLFFWMQFVKNLVSCEKSKASFHSAVLEINFVTTYKNLEIILFTFHNKRAS